MSQCRDTGVEAEPLGEDGLDIFDPDGLHFKVVCAFSDNDNSLAFSHGTMLPEDDVCQSQSTVMVIEIRRTLSITEHMWSSHGSCVGGRSGIKAKSAPALRCGEIH